MVSGRHECSITPVWLAQVLRPGSCYFGGRLTNEEEAMGRASELSSAFIAAFNRKDGDAMWELLHPEVRYQVSGGASFSGISSVQAYYLNALARDIQAENRSIIDSCDVVFAENRLTGTLPDGRSYSMEQCVRHRWDDGLLVEYRNYNDPPSVEGDPVTLEQFMALITGASEPQ